MSHFQDGGHDVISHRKVMPSGECICTASAQRPLVRCMPYAVFIVSQWVTVVTSDLRDLSKIVDSFDLLSYLPLSVIPFVHFYLEQYSISLCRFHTDCANINKCKLSNFAP